MKVKCPVLAVNGEKDIQVPAKDNLEVIRKALELGGNKNYTVLILPNLNHLFQTAETGAISEYERIEETMSVLALDSVSNWILRHTTSGAPQLKPAFRPSRVLVGMKHPLTRRMDMILRTTVTRG